MGFSGTPKDMGPPYGGTHTTPIRIPKDMGMVWVPLTIRGFHYWRSLESPLTFPGFRGRFFQVPSNVWRFLGERWTAPGGKHLVGPRFCGMQKSISLLTPLPPVRK